jgi:CIC family chloride channel protein
VCNIFLLKWLPILVKYCKYNIFAANTISVMKDPDERIPLSPSLIMTQNRARRAASGNMDRRVLLISLQAIINAVIIGLVARGLVYLIDLITNLAFYGRLSFAPSNPAHNHLGIFVIAVPVIGSLIVGLMARFGSGAIRGHGIPEAMEKIILDNSRIPPLITWLKPLSAAISIGTGGPFGAEGPIIATGGAFGSLTGQMMHISANERKIILSAGACAGMSAIFGSPLAAVLLAVELLLFEFSARSLVPVALACVTGAGMHLWLFGSDPVFAMPHLAAPPASALLIYTAMGLVIGIVAGLVSKSVYAVEDLFEKLPIHWMWWPAIGALAVGGVGFFAPYTMGVGYENIDYLLGGKLPLAMILGLCLLKYISWVISLGSGTSGGTLAPLLTIGGAFGALLGTLLLDVFPNAGISLPVAALVGMAAMFAGASRAFLTAVVFALETTGQANGLFPLLGACAAAYGVSFVVMKGSIMTEKIRRRGVATPDRYEPDLLSLSTVAKVFVPGPETANAGLPKVTTEDSLSACLELMGARGVDTLTVVDPVSGMKVLGTVRAAEIMRFYSRQRSDQSRYDSPARTRRWMVRTRRAMKHV